MVFVVERYLPGLSQEELLRSLERLTPGLALGTSESGQEALVRYLGSTIVPADEACFCQFDGPTAAAVADANRRAGVPFDRIVPAVTVDPKGAGR